MSDAAVRLSPVIQLELFRRSSERPALKVGMTLVSLQSGSDGNATLVSAGGTSILIDCGLSPSRLEKRLRAIGHVTTQSTSESLRSPDDSLRASQLAAVLVTHEHTDHAGGCGVLARKLGVPIYVTHGSAIEMAQRILPSPAEREHVRFLPPSRVLAFRDGVTVDPGVAHDLKVEWVPVPHDGSQPVNFVVERGGVRAGILTDLGHANKPVRELFETLDVAFLESNHDRERLRDGPYPRSLKQRIASSLGHLSNGEAARLVRDHASSRLGVLVLLHLSAVNNEPALAEAAMRGALERRRDLSLQLHIAPPDRPSTVLEV
jgi:phosphoribosyl 1,2-cyclic phosphodiesterase